MGCWRMDACTIACQAFASGFACSPSAVQNTDALSSENVYFMELQCTIAASGWPHACSFQGLPNWLQEHEPLRRLHVFIEDDGIYHWLHAQRGSSNPGARSVPPPRM